jgi:hypothetical protein
MGEYLIKKIKDVHFKDPILKDLKFIVIEKYNRMQEIKYKISVLQDELKMLEDNWNEISDNFILEFEE